MASAQALQEEHQQLRKAVDLALVEGDALSAYDDFVKFMIEKQPKDKQGLLQLLREATSAYKDDPIYQNDRTYLKLWAIYATLVDRPAAVYAYILKRGIGAAWAKTYEEYAEILERTAQWAKADAVYRDGIARNTKGAPRLKALYTAFLARAPAGSTDASSLAPSSTSSSAQPKPSSSAPPKAGSSSSSTRAGKPAHRRYAYIRAHLRSGGVPQPGKRPERFAYDFGQLFTPDGVEYSVQEARARHLGVLGKHWALEPVEPPPAAIPPSPAASTPSSSPARVPVDFNEGAGAGRTTTRRALGAEPTVTINTKEALADVFGMYNSPEKTLRHGALPGSKHAPTRRVEPFAAPGPSAPPLMRSLTDENLGSLRAGKSGVSFKPFVDIQEDQHSGQENRASASARAKTHTSFVPFVDGQEDEDMAPPRRTPAASKGISFQPYVDEEEDARAPTPPAARGVAFRPFVDENAGAVLSRSQSLRQPIPEEDEDADMQEPESARSKTPTFRPFMETSDELAERSKTPRAIEQDLPAQTPSFRPYVDENAGPPAARKEQDSRTPAPLKSKPFAETDRSNRTPLASADVTPTASSPKVPSTGTEQDPADEDVEEVGSEGDTEPLSAPIHNTSSASNSENAPSGMSRSISLSSISPHAASAPPLAATVRGGVERAASLSAVAAAAAEADAPAPAKPSVFIARVRSASQSGDALSPVDERARTLSASGAGAAAGPFGFAGAVFRPPALAKPGAQPFRPQRAPKPPSGPDVFQPAPARAPLQSVPLRTVTPPPVEEEEEAEAEAGREEYVEEGSHRQIVSRCGGVFEAMTPIAERTMEFTAGSSARTPMASPNWQLGTRRDSERAALDAAGRLAAELAEVEEEEEEEGYSVVEDAGPLPAPVSAGVFATATPPPATPVTLDALPNPCNPFEPEILTGLLAAQPDEPGYHDCTDQDAGMLADLQKFARKPKGDTFPLNLDGRRFAVSHKLGEGGFGAVFQARDRDLRAGSAGDGSDEDEDEDEGDESAQVALKVVRPRNRWEFAAIRRAHTALPEDARRSIITAREMFAFRDESFLVLDLCPCGTLLDVVNGAGALNLARAGAALDEGLAMFFAVELLRALGALHAAGLIHGDLKIDNCLVRLEDVPGGRGAWAPRYSATGVDGWAHKGVALVDFGRAIDTRAFAPGQTFVGDWPADARDCAEMRDGRAWTFEADYFGLAGVLYTLLFGKHVDAGAIAREGGPDGRQRLAHPLKRYWQTDLWGSLFDVLLNPRAVRPSGELPLCDELAALRGEMEAWLEKNADKPAVNLQAMLKRIARGVM